MKYRAALMAACATVALAAVPVSGAHAENLLVKGFYSPERPLGEALINFSQKYDMVLLASQELIQGKRAPAVQGDLTRDDALVRLLRGSGLSYAVNADGAVTITPRAKVQRASVQTTTQSQAMPKVDRRVSGADSHRPRSMGSFQVAQADTGSTSSVDASVPADAAGSAPLEEIKITGSRIVRTGMTTPTPVTTISSQDLQDMAPTTLVDALVQMPQFLNSETPQTQSFGTSGSAGASFINLRSLASQRTLTLLDGRRVVPATRSGSPNTALFPQELVSRVDVVTGGASAAYGSDAVAGVVNFILDTDFEGVKGHAQGGLTDRGDGDNYNLGVAWGTSVGDRGHLISSAEFYKANGVKDYFNRPWMDSSAMVRNTGDGPTYITGHDVHGGNFTWGGLITGGPLAGTQFDDNGDPVPFDYGQDHTSTSQIGGSGFDSGKYQWMTSNEDRYALFSHFKYDLSDNLSAFVQGLYGYSQTSFETAPATMWGYRPATIYIENPYLPQSVKDQMIANDVTSFPFGKMQADQDLGSPFVTNTNKMVQVTAGLDGNIDDWKYNLYYQYGQNESDLLYENVARVDRMYDALDTQLDPATGQITCTSTLADPSHYCVPLDPFGVGTTSAEAKKWIMGDTKEQHQLIKQHVAEATISGDPFENWAGVVSVAAGASYRKESLLSEPRTNPPGLENVSVPSSVDYRGLPGGYLGAANIFERTAGADLRGGYHVWEAFGETIFPLLRDMTGFQSVDLNAAVRYANYSGSGGIWAWKLGLDWQVYNDLRLRGTLSRDVRAGTLQERFDLSGRGATVTDRASTDPAIKDSVYTISYDQGGNPNVNPEKADTITFGAVYQPSFLDGFSASVDYFDIKIKGAISLLGVQNIVDDCANGSQALCDLISRAPDGRINRIRNVYLNIDQYRSRGIDFELQYNTRAHIIGGSENLNFRLFATRMLELSRTVPGGIKTDTVGQIGWGGGAPKLQVNASVNYRNGPVSVFVQERYIGTGVKRSTWVEGVDVDNNHMPSRLYTNLRLAYDFETAGGSWTAFANVTNLFDQDPPFAGNTFGFFGTAYTNESLYDVLGRRYTVGLRFRY